MGTKRRIEPMNEKLARLDELLAHEVERYCAGGYGEHDADLIVSQAFNPSMRRKTESKRPGTTR